MGRFHDRQYTKKKKKNTLHFFQTAQIPAKKLRSFDSYTPKIALYGIFRAAFNSSLDAPYSRAPLGFGSCRVPAPSLTTTHTKLYSAFASASAADNIEPKGPGPRAV